MLLQDVSYALRQLRRKPGFALTVIATLALGIGATTVVYSIVDAVLLRPLPFTRPERLVTLSNLETVAGGAVRTNDTSYPNFYDWRAQNKSFQSISCYKTAGYTMAGFGGGPATRSTGVMVSSDFFSTLEVAPLLGRAFRRDDEHAGNRAVVIGYGLWQSRFAAQPNIVGRTLILDEETYTIVGVMPKGFQYPLDAPDVQFWVTTAHDAEGPGASISQRGYNQLEVVARLRDGVTLQQARAEMQVIQTGLAARYPDDDKNVTAVELTPASEALTGDVRQPLRTLFAAVVFLLLIACANAAGLLLTQASSRVRELLVRAAVGASRGRILRQLITEAVTLSVTGGLLGVALAYGAIRVIPTFLPAGLVRAQSIALNGPVLLFALAVSIGTGMVFGVVPAWRMSLLAPSMNLREQQRGTTPGRRQHALHSALVIIEISLSLILLAGAGLLMRSFSRIISTNPGFDPQHLLTFRIATPESRYSDERRVVFFNQLLSRLKSQPGVEAATAAFPLPLAGGNIRISFSIAGQPVVAGDEPSERVSLVSSNFFRTMRIALQHGRYFSEAEQNTHAPQVVIINEAFAHKYFPGVDPVGQHLRSGLGAGNPPPMREVVGVVSDVKRGSLTEPSQPEYYVPIEQAPVAPPAVALRVSGDPAAFENTVQTTVSSLDAALPVYRLHPYSDELARTTAQQRFQTSLIGFFALVALVMAAVGLYALLGYIVVQRTAELGLCIALGAPRSHVLRIILTRGMALSVLGLIFGLSASVGLTHFLAGMLFQTKALDAPTLATVSLVLFAVASLASLVPAYQASHLEPIDALRRQE